MVAAAASIIRRLVLRNCATSNWRATQVCNVNQSLLCCSTPTHVKPPRLCSITCMLYPQSANYRAAALRNHFEQADIVPASKMGDAAGSVEVTQQTHTADQGLDSSYHILPQWHSKPNHLRVICVGAGAAGLLVAYKMKKNFTNYDLVCYEKNPSVAGTWYENRYPGAACDVPAHAVCILHFTVIR